MARQRTQSAEDTTLIVSITLVALLGIAFGLVIRSLQRRKRVVVLQTKERAAELRQHDLVVRLQQALEMAHTEEATYPVINKTLRKGEPGLVAELLIADSSRAHFRQVLSTDDVSMGPGCPVGAPSECPAASRGQTQIYPSSSEIDACPYLEHRPTGDCSGVCVPVSIAGKTVGVLHATGPDYQPPSDAIVNDLELIAQKSGERIGMLRAFARSENQARVDPLTGLFNRRSLETQVRELEDGEFVVAYGDLDHFKQLNDLYGHDAGDRALRLFARVLRDSVRPNDIPARYGGEEFVVVLPDCAAASAYAVVARLRERLSNAQETGLVPPFTVSFGLAASETGSTFSETVELADHALLEAKAAGRDRIIVHRGDELVGLTLGEAIPSTSPVITAS